MESQSFNPFESSSIAEAGDAFGIPGEAGGTARLAGTAGNLAATPDQPSSMAESVTRHALNPPLVQFRYLLSGLDSVDLGLYVEWDFNWQEKACDFQDKKEESCGSNGIIDTTPKGRNFIHLPSGKAPNYRYHLQFPEYHAYIAITQKPHKSPNVYISLSSETLWQRGILPSLDLVFRDIQSFGGNIVKMVPSRLDLSVDYLIPGGITLPFLKDHQVNRSRVVIPYLNGEELETYYVGSPSTPIRMRIYNKSKEVRKKGIKLWFFGLWQVEEDSQVWRVEFQLRRPVLKQFGVNKDIDLWEKAGGLWVYLTREWFSLRLPDNPKPERRTVHPWWADVQACAEQLGPAIELQRKFTGDTPASIEWFLSHVSGCITSIAARMGVADRGAVLDHLREVVPTYCPEHVFEQEFLKRSIKLGRNPGGQGAENEEDDYPF